MPLPEEITLKQAVPPTNQSQPKLGFLSWLESQKLHGVRDGAQVSFTRTVVDDVSYTTPEIELIYHIDATTHTCGFPKNLTPENINGEVDDRKLRVGMKPNGVENIVTYPGPWMIDRLSIEDRGDNTTRVNITVSKIGTPIKITPIDPGQTSAQEWVPQGDVIAPFGATQET